MKKDINIEIGSRIRKKREAFGYSRQQLAEKAELSVQFLADVELGTKGISSATLKNISRALGISSDSILFGRENDSDLSEIIDLLSGLDEEYIPLAKELVGAYVKSVTLAKNKR